MTMTMTMATAMMTMRAMTTMMMDEDDDVDDDEDDGDENGDEDGDGDNDDDDDGVDDDDDDDDHDSAQECRPDQDWYSCFKLGQSHFLPRSCLTPVSGTTRARVQTGGQEHRLDQDRYQSLKPLCSDPVGPWRVAPLGRGRKLMIRIADRIRNCTPLGSRVSGTSCSDIVRLRRAAPPGYRRTPGNRNADIRPGVRL